ncbi:uncharacterized protein A4U43_C10F17370 [Asparagus officinalis]|uniref:SHSP domain-containing protein n=1 Tax=Asparagus officinalis TaxID=4686 RepID=A0A5P1E6U1_ASPOF|nr:uncharacterized protein A4U43_C10F17370 [Asparagus officinalis]
MSPALSNLAATFSVPPLPYPSSQRRRMMPTVSNGLFSVKAMMGESLDHLQRENKQQKITQQQPKRRAAQSAPLGLWDRFPTARTIQQMMDTMDRIMEDPFAYAPQTPTPLLTNEDPTAMPSTYRRGRTPWEIKEKEEEYKLRFDMPGMTKGDVKVWVEEKMLVIKAEKLRKKEEEGEKEVEGGGGWDLRSYGRYNSRIALPENVEVEKIKAEVKDGVLYITIPKAKVSAKVLDINVE